MKTIEGHLSAKGKKFALVIGRFNSLLSRHILEGAVDCLIRHGALEKDLEIVWVPGSFEIPMAADKLAKSKKYQAIVCLGVLIRGATPHFDHIAAEVTKGIAQVALNSSLPVMYGIVTADTLEQAIERCGTKAGNKGSDAALAAIEMADLFQKI